MPHSGRRTVGSVMTDPTGATPRYEHGLVTVIIPAYNAQATLAETVTSVLAQTYDHLQVLVVDDGSTDDTVAIAERCSGSDPRVRFLKQANGGVARARNAGLARSEGEFTAWLDADDVWHPQKIAQQIEVFRTANTSLSYVFTGYRQIDSNNRIIAHHRPLTDVTGFSVSRQIATNFFSNTSSIMVRTELARGIGGHDPRLRDWGIEGAEDLLLQLQLALRGRVGCCKQALVGYRMHDRNMSLGYRRAALSNLKALDLVQEMQGSPPAWVFRIARARVVGFALFALRNGDIGGAASVFASILRGQPLETVVMCARILEHRMRETVSGPIVRDPEVGCEFAAADPASVPWQPHILLSRRQQRRLAALDSKLAPCMNRSLKA